MKAKDGDMTAEFLRSVLSYDPETGLFAWICKPGIPRVPGISAGTEMKEGYIRIQINRHSYKAHRLAWLYMTGAWPDGEVDHINRMRNDNRWVNLRVGSRSQNQANREPKPGREIKAKGVSFSPSRTYIVKIYCRGKAYFAGRYKTEDEAAHAYNKLAIKHFGEFAVLNPIGVDK